MFFQPGRIWGTNGALWGDIQEHFGIHFESTQSNFGRLFATETKHIKNKIKRSETKQVGTDPSAVAGLGGALWTLNHQIQKLRT